MDVVFHGVVGLVLSRALTGEYLPEAALFAVLPDIIGATPYTFFKLQRSDKRSVNAFLSSYSELTGKGKYLRKFDKVAYRGAHSWLALLPVGIVVWWWKPEIWPLLTLSYFSHLLVDAPTHEGDFAARPFYPLINWRLSGGQSWWKKRGLFLGFWGGLLIVASMQIFT